MNKPDKMYASKEEKSRTIPEKTFKEAHTAIDKLKGKKDALMFVMTLNPDDQNTIVISTGYVRDIALNLAKCLDLICDNNNF